MMELKARAFAVRKHGNQLYGGLPYVEHLDQVVAVLKEFEYTNPLFTISGYLHDTLEDTDATVREIIYEFGQPVAEIVVAVTAIGKNRAEKTANTIENLKKLKKAIPVKMADRLSNMRFSSAQSRKHIEMYRKELPLYAPLFKKVNKKMYEEMLKL